MKKSYKINICLRVFNLFPLKDPLVSDDESYFLQLRSRVPISLQHEMALLFLAGAFLWTRPSVTFQGATPDVFYPNDYICIT